MLNITKKNYIIFWLYSKESTTIYIPVAAMVTIANRIIISIFWFIIGKMHPHLLHLFLKGLTSWPHPQHRKVDINFIISQENYYNPYFLCVSSNFFIRYRHIIPIIKIPIIIPLPATTVLMTSSKASNFSLLKVPLTKNYSLSQDYILQQQME